MSPERSRCAHMEEALSARVDGEDPGVSADVLDAHLARCGRCRRFDGAIQAQRRALRMRISDVPPDLAPVILAAIPEGPAPTGRPTRRRRRRALVLASGSVAAALLVGVGYLSGGAGSSGSSGNSVVSIRQVAGSAQSDPRYPGATVFPAAEAVAKPDVELTDTAGQPVDLAAATAGRITLVYFGYTNCPDICPINMALTADALRRLPVAQRKDVSVVFITTDPERDTGPAIRSWLDHFDAGLPPFVGLRGTPAQITQAERQVRMALSYSEPVAGGGYDEVHAGYTLIYPRGGRAELQVDDTETPAEYATTLQHLVTSGFVRT